MGLPSRGSRHPGARRRSGRHEPGATIRTAAGRGSA